MAKSGHTFAKRKREQEKKEKAAKKRAKRAAQKQQPGTASGFEIVGDDPLDEHRAGSITPEDHSDLASETQET